MELMTVLPAILAGAGLLFSLFAMYQAAKSLRHRLSIEKKISHYLAEELKCRGVDSSVSVSSGRIIISGKVDGRTKEEIKQEIDECVESAVKSLLADERYLVMKSLRQPSKRGQEHYLSKLLSNSLHELDHVRV